MKNWVRIALSLAILFSTFSGSAAFAEEPKSELPKSVLQIFFEGKRPLQKISRPVPQGGIFLADGLIWFGVVNHAIHGQRILTDSLIISWKSNDGTFVTSYIPFSKVRTRPDANTTTPTVEFTIYCQRVVSTGTQCGGGDKALGPFGVQWVMDEWVEYIVLTLNPKDCSPQLSCRP